MSNHPYPWLTPQVFYEFAMDTGLTYVCMKCNTLPKMPYVDVGDEGFIPRSSSYTSTSEGLVNMSQSRHIPCVRVLCTHCGHIDLYSMFSIDQWWQRRARMQQPQLGGLFGLGGPQNGG